MSKLSPEQYEHILLFDWIRTRKDIEPYAWHTANERKTSLAQGALLKRMGVKPGVSDLFVAIPKGGYHGLFLELKVGNNKPTPSQKDFINRMNEQGYLAMCVVGFDASKAVIEAYMKD